MLRTSARVYVNKNDINTGVCSDSEACALHRTLQRTALKGKCFCIGLGGIFVGPNYSTIDRMNSPNLLLGKKAEKFIKEFDYKGKKAKPTHVTIIDPSGRYL